MTIKLKKENSEFIDLFNFERLRARLFPEIVEKERLESLKNNSYEYGAELAREVVEKIFADTKTTEE